MKTLLALMSVAGLLVGTVGCHTTIGHDAGECVEVSSHEVRARVAVLRFVDRRPEEERWRPNEFFTWWDVTTDGWWDEADVAGAVSEEIVRRLRESGLYAQVDYVASGGESFGPDMAQSLREKGYDAVLCGEIVHFHGERRQDFARGALLSLAGPAGSGAGFLMGHQARGLTTLDSVRLARTHDGEVVWEGRAQSDINESSYLFEDAGTYANRSLDLAITDLHAQMDGQAPGIAAGLRVEVRASVAARGEVGSGTSLVVAPFQAGVDGVKQIGKEAGKVVDSAIDVIFGLLQ